MIADAIVRTCDMHAHLTDLSRRTLKHGVVRKHTPLQCARIEENTPLPTDGGYGITHFHGRGVWIHTPVRH